MPRSGERHLEEPSGLHAGWLIVSPPKGPVLVFHEKHGIIFPPLELVHRHDADTGYFPVVAEPRQHIGRQVGQYDFRRYDVILARWS